MTKRPINTPHRYPTCPDCGALLINDGRCPRGHARASAEDRATKPRKRPASPRKRTKP
jgi:hypothetical protein